jgi:hypothetical protein
MRKNEEGIRGTGSLIPSLVRLPRNVCRVPDKPLAVSHALADVTLDIQNPDRPIGVFGEFRTLTLRFSRALVSPRVWAQDLLADEAQDVTDRVRFTDRSMILDGALISQVGLAAATAHDPSGPGLILKVETSGP